MESTRAFKSILPFALAGLLFAGGCNKQSSQQPSTSTPAATSQSTAPPPPADQSGTAATAAAPNGAAPAAAASAAGAPAAAPAESAAAPAAPPPPPPPLVVPAGTHIAVTIQQALGSKISQPGQTFAATVAAPIVINGTTVIRAGSSATGTVVDAKASGHFKGGALLELRLDAVRAMGNRFQIATNTLQRIEKGKGKRTAGFVGGGAGLGAIIGGVAGGGKGALIGGLAGAGAGTAGAGLTGNKEIVIPAETTLTFRLARSLRVIQ